MLIRLMHLLSVLAVIGAGGILALCVVQWRHGAGVAKFSAETIQVKPQGVALANGEERLSPLMTAAQGFASYLTPPPPPAQQGPAVHEMPRPESPIVRPPTATPQFKVRGTICAGPSEKSIALIWEPGAREGGRWLKEGARLGHFVVHEIRPGSVLYLDGEKLCEMVIERETAPGATVATGNRPDTPRSQAAADAARPTQTDGRVKRPTSSGRFTVGSAHTTTLD